MAPAGGLELPPGTTAGDRPGQRTTCKKERIQNLRSRDKDKDGEGEGG